MLERIANKVRVVEELLELAGTANGLVPDGWSGASRVGGQMRATKSELGVVPGALSDSASAQRGKGVPKEVP
jgi:hypothetical protein